MTFSAVYVTILTYPIRGGSHAHQPESNSYFVLSEAEVSSLIRAATSFRNRTILRTLYLTGLRRQELCNLSVEDVDLERSRLLIRAGKGDKSRVVPIAESLVADLRAYIGRRTSGPLFLS
jgi:integrase